MLICFTEVQLDALWFIKSIKPFNWWYYTAYVITVGHHHAQKIDHLKVSHNACIFKCEDFRTQSALYSPLVPLTLWWGSRAHYYYFVRCYCNQKNYNWDTLWYLLISIFFLLLSNGSNPTNVHQLLLPTRSIMDWKFDFFFVERPRGQ